MLLTFTTPISIPAGATRAEAHQLWLRARIAFLENTIGNVMDRFGYGQETAEGMNTKCRRIEEEIAKLQGELVA